MEAKETKACGTVQAPRSIHSRRLIMTQRRCEARATPSSMFVVPRGRLNSARANALSDAHTDFAYNYNTLYNDTGTRMFKNYFAFLTGSDLLWLCFS